MLSVTDVKARENVLSVTDDMRENVLSVIDSKRGKTEEVVNLEQSKSSDIWLEPHCALETSHFLFVLCYSVATK